MTIETMLGVGALIALAAFIVFAFRQGQSVKPTENPPPRNDYT
jgi:hypothetical protein